MTPMISRSGQGRPDTHERRAAAGTYPATTDQIQSEAHLQRVGGGGPTSPDPAKDHTAPTRTSPGPVTQTPHPATVQSIPSSAAPGGAQDSASSQEAIAAQREDAAAGAPDTVPADQMTTGIHALGVGGDGPDLPGPARARPEPKIAAPALAAHHSRCWAEPGHERCALRAAALHAEQRAEYLRSVAKLAGTPPQEAVDAARAQLDPRHTPRAPYRPGSRCLTDDQRDLICDLYGLNGGDIGLVSMRWLAGYFQVSETTIRGVLQQYTPDLPTDLHRRAAAHAAGRRAGRRPDPRAAAAA